MSRSSAFISSGVRRRPERTLPWQAIVAHTESKRSFKAVLTPSRTISAARSCDQSSDVAVAEQRRHLAHDDGARAEGLDDKAEFGQLIRFVGQRRRLVVIEVDDDRDQQSLARNAALGSASP